MVEYEVDIRTEGMYQLSLTYYPVEGNGSSIQRAFFLDGELPYKQLSEIEFSRVWTNSVSEWASDNQGNDLKPTQVEAPEWVESQLYDAEGYVVERKGAQRGRCACLADKGVFCLCGHGLPGL